MPDNESIAVSNGANWTDDRRGSDDEGRIDETRSVAGSDKRAEADAESEVDGCDVAVGEPTPDEDLPASTGGVA